MKINILGSGTIIPTAKKAAGTPSESEGKQRSYSSIYIKFKSEDLLLDVGPGTLVKLQSLGVNTQLQPDRLFITHYHIDHVGDYPALAKSRCFNLKTDKVGKGKKLKVYGPNGLTHWNKDLFVKTRSWQFMSDELKVFNNLNLNEVNKNWSLKTKDYQIDCLPVPHADGVAYRIKSAGKTLVYSGDMGYHEPFANFAKNADLVIIECSAPSKKTDAPNHLCPEQIGQMAQIGSWKKTVLTHLYPRCEGKEDQMIKLVKKYAPHAKVDVAYDLMNLSL